MNPPSTSTPSAASRAAHPVGERDELGDPGRVDRAVADEQQRGHRASRRRPISAVEQRVDRGCRDARRRRVRSGWTRPAARTRAARPSRPPPRRSPTGSPTTSGLCTRPASAQRTSSASAVGALPITQTAPSGCRATAARIPAAERVSPASAAPPARSSATTAGRAVMPGGDHPHVGDQRRPGEQRLPPRPQRVLVADEVAGPRRVGAGVHHPLDDRTRERRQVGGVEPGCAGSRTTPARWGARRHARSRFSSPGVHARTGSVVGCYARSGFLRPQGAAVRSQWRVRPGLAPGSHAADRARRRRHSSRVRDVAPARAGCTHRDSRTRDTTRGRRDPFRESGARESGSGADESRPADAPGYYAGPAASSPRSSPGRRGCRRRRP